MLFNRIIGITIIAMATLFSRVQAEQIWNDSHLNQGEVKLILFGGSVSIWSPTPSEPMLDPKKVNVGGGYEADDNGTITVVQGEKIKLSAKAKDTDTLNGSDGTTQTFDDGASIVWSASGGTFNISRTASGQQTEFTAPNVPEGQDSTTVSVTATPDDDSIDNPGGPLDENEGNRNDTPNANGKATLNIKVLKNCPQTVTLKSTCMVPYEAGWQTGLKSFGIMTAHQEVGGGTPPNPPNNWNGLYIKEVAVRHPNDPGDAEAQHFDGGYNPDQHCPRASAGFVVGSAKSDLPNCQRPAVDNRFWDDHSFQAALPVLKEGENDRTLNCQQKYYCGNTELNGTFKITRKFHNTTYDPDGSGPGAPYRVTEVQTSKTAE